MLQSHQFNADTETQPQPVQWTGHRSGNRLDCETGALLRQILAPIFAQAASWEDLHSALQTRGYMLGFEEARLILLDKTQHTKICSCRFLGYPLAGLSERLGKVRTRPAQQGSYALLA